MQNFKTCVPKSLQHLTVCLTGASGYVGKHLIQTLKIGGITPVLIGRPNSLATDNLDVETVGKWTSPADLAASLDRYDRLIVLNLAGYFISNHGPHDIKSLISGNYEFPVNVFEALALSRHDRIVNVGTSWEFSDTGAVKPANLYASLKASNAATLEWYSAQRELRAINLKLNDTFGGDDTRSKLMPLLKESAHNDLRASLRYSSQEINLLYITDVLEGLLAAAEFTTKVEPGNAETVFLLGYETLTLGALVQRIRDRVAPELNVTFERESPEEGKLRSVWEDCPRLPNWRPRISLNDGLSEYFGNHNAT